MTKETALQKLYEAVDAYCMASKTAAKPIPESYWRNVTLAWQNAKRVIEPGKEE